MDGRAGIEMRFRDVMPRTLRFVPRVWSFSGFIRPEERRGVPRNSGPGLARSRRGAADADIRVRVVDLEVAAVGATLAEGRAEPAAPA